MHGETWTLHRPATGRTAGGRLRHRAHLKKRTTNARTDRGHVAGHDAKVAGDGGDEDEVDLRMGGEGRRGRGMKGGGGEG